MADRRYVIEIVINDQGAISTLTRVGTTLATTGTKAKKAEGDLTALERAMRRATTAGTAMGNAIYGAAAALARMAVGGFVGFVSEAVQVSSQMNNALIGLASVARSTGNDLDKTKAAALELTKDGLMPLGEASMALKNLMGAGFNLDRSIKLMERFKDIAAFNRQAALSYGQAIVGATEGIKNQNSILIDNMGLTKNYSVIMREMGLKMEDLVRLRHDQALQEKVYQGFVKETMMSYGDAARLANTYTGALSRMQVAQSNMKKSWGDVITQSPAVAIAVNAVSDVYVGMTADLKDLKKYTDQVADAMALLMTVFQGVSLIIGTVRLAFNGFTSLMAKATKTVATSVLNMTETIAEGIYTAASLITEPGAQSALLELGEKVLARINPLREKAAAAIKAANDQLAADRQDVDKTILGASAQLLTLEGIKNRILKSKGTVGPKAAEGGTTPTPPATKEDSDTKSAKKKMEDLEKDIDRARKDIYGAWQYSDALIEEFGKRARDVATEITRLGLKVSNSVGLMARSAGWAEFAESADKSVTAVLASLNKLTGDEAGRIVDAYLSNTKAMTEAQRTAQQEMLQNQMGPWKHAEGPKFDIARANLDQWLADELRGLNRSSENWRETAATFVKRHAEAMRQIEADEKAAEAAMVETPIKWGQAWRLGLAGVTEAWAQLSQISGVSSNATVRGIGKTLGTMNVATKSIDGMKAGWDGFTKAGAKASAKFASAIGMVTSAMGLVGTAIDVLLPLFSKPAYKDVMKRVGRDWGVSISEGLAQGIADQAKTLFKGNRQAAELFNLDKIIGEAGGLTSANADKFTAKLRDVFSMVQTGAMTVAQARETLDKNFNAFAQNVLASGKIASQGFQELLDLNQQFGTDSAAIRDFVTGQLTRGGKALATLFGDLKRRTTEAGAAMTEMATAQAELDAAMAGGSYDDAARAADRLATAIEKVKAIQASQGASAQATAAEVQRAGRLLMAMFNAGVKNGVDWLTILDQIGPGLDTVIEALKAVGGSVEDSSVSWLVAWRDKVNANKELVASAGALNEVMLTLSNIGALSVEALADLEAQGVQTYNQLIDKGFTSQEALAALVPWLKNVRDAHVQLKVPMDAETGALLEQATAAGLMKDAGTEMIDVLKEGLGAIITALRGELPAAWKASAEGLMVLPPKVDDLATAVAGVGTALDRVDVQGWAVQAVRAFGDVEEAATGVAVGHSPGGIKEIPTELAKAEDALAAFRAMAVDQFGAVETAVGAVARAADELDGIISDIEWEIGDVIATPVGRQLRAVDRELNDTLAKLEPWRDKDPIRYLEAVEKAKQLAELKAREIVYADRTREQDAAARNAPPRVSFPRPDPWHPVTGYPVRSAPNAWATLDPDSIKRLMDALKSGLILEVDGFELATRVFSRGPEVIDAFVGTS